jgi:hypothetical protein
VADFAPRCEGRSRHFGAPSGASDLPRRANHFTDFCRLIPLDGLSRRANPLRAKSNLSKDLSLIFRFGFTAQKFHFHFSEMCDVYVHPASDQRGVSANRHGRWKRDAMDAFGA